MRYRALSATGDHQFGRAGIFLTNSPEAVRQAVQTRLSLWTGEWFLDLQEGTPYEELILGFNNQGLRDQIIKERVLETQGVDEITDYQSVKSADRRLAISITINTVYGQTTIGTEPPQ